MNQSTDSSELNLFAPKLGKSFGNLASYMIIQIIVTIISSLIVAAGMISSLIGTSSTSEIFIQLRSLVNTIFFISIILAGISYYFVYKVIVVIKEGETQNFQNGDKLRMSRLFLIGTIILQIISFIIGYIVLTQTMTALEELLNSNNFDETAITEFTNQAQSGGIFSTLLECAGLGLYAASFLQIKTFFEGYEQLINDNLEKDRLQKGLMFLVVGYGLVAAGTLIGLGLSGFGSLLNIVGWILYLVGYFKAAKGLKQIRWGAPASIDPTMQYGMSGTQAAPQNTAQTTGYTSTPATDKKICPACHSENDANTKFCMNCGYQF